MSVDVFVASQPGPVDGKALVDEHGDAKAERLALFFDEFIDSDFGVSAISWKGQSIMLVKHDEVRHAHIDPGIDAEL